MTTIQSIILITALIIALLGIMIIGCALVVNSNNTLLRVAIAILIPAILVGTILFYESSKDRPRDPQKDQPYGVLR